MKTLPCREHGGTFQVLPRRGRPPVRCTPDNPCQFYTPPTEENPFGTIVSHDTMPTAKRASAVPAFSSAPSRVEATASAIKNKRMAANATKTLDQMSAAELRAYARSIGMSTATKLTEAPDLRRAIRKYRAEDEFETVKDASGRAIRPADTITTVKDASGRVTGLQGPRRKAPQKAAEVTTRVNPSVPKAHEARARLVDLGWTVQGRAWFAKDAGYAEITATRGDETLIMRWSQGALEHQHYALWDVDRPASNNTPDNDLPFDPDEIPDSELVKILAGMRVTWWNKLAQSKECEVASAQTIEITHAYNGIGDETPADRIVKFVAMNGGGFRAFRLGALLKIGS